MELSIDNKRDIDQALKESLEAIEDLAMDNHDIRPSFAVWSPWRRQASINHIRNHQIALNTQVPAVGEHTGGGEAGVLDLQTMQWTRIEIYDETGVEDEMHSGVETAQESANANETGTMNEVMLPSSQAVLSHFRVASRCNYTGFWYSFYDSGGTAGRRRGRGRPE